MQLSYKVADGSLITSVEGPTLFARCHQESAVREQREVPRRCRCRNTQPFAYEIGTHTVLHEVPIDLRRKGLNRLFEQAHYF
jgi:hypothetical protein